MCRERLAHFKKPSEKMCVVKRLGAFTHRAVFVILDQEGTGLAVNLSPYSALMPVKGKNIGSQGVSISVSISMGVREEEGR